jgi:hypothetical protein
LLIQRFVAIHYAVAAKDNPTPKSPRVCVLQAATAGR